MFVQFIPNTPADPSWSKSAVHETKPSPYTPAVKTENAHSHSRKSTSAVPVASKPSSTAAAASKSDGSIVGSGRSGKPTSLALNSATVASGKQTSDGLQPVNKCVTPQTPDSFADLFSQPHLTVKQTVIMVSVVIVSIELCLYVKC